MLCSSTICLAGVLACCTQGGVYLQGLAERLWLWLCLGLLCRDEVEKHATLVVACHLMRHPIPLDLFSRLALLHRQRNDLSRDSSWEVRPTIWCSHCQRGAGALCDQGTSDYARRHGQRAAGRTSVEAAGMSYCRPPGALTRGGLAHDTRHMHLSFCRLQSLCLITSDPINLHTE